jgi:NAD dependent epimerase/dehydratase family enzyme
VVAAKMLDEFGSSLLNSLRAVPAKLQKSGYKFTYPGLASGLVEIVNR